MVILVQVGKAFRINLQFTRLGAIINGVRLHAMVGEMRDLCFG